MIRKTTELKTFRDFDFTMVRMPLITVYEKPKDMPDKYVARLFDINQPTEFAVVGDSLSDIREAIPEWMVKINPEAEDIPQIKEVYM